MENGLTEIDGTVTLGGDIVGSGLIFGTDLTIVSVVLNKEENQIEVIKRQPSMMTLAVYPPRPAADSVWKEVYAVGDDGNLYLKETIQGEVTPAKYIEEKIEFKKNS
jgi:hypothetical protein